MNEDLAGSRAQREAEFHDRVFADGHRRSASKYYAILEPLKQQKKELISGRAAGARILEYGCGPAGMTTQFWTEAKSVDLIDVSPVAIEQVRLAAEGVSHVRARVMNAEDLEFSSNSFDLVVGDGILHHLDLSVALSEIDRVLAPHGTALFIEPQAANPIVSLYRRLTPSQRTEDEHPLDVHDYALITDRFPRTKIHPAGLLSLAAIAVPTSKGRTCATLGLTKLDRALFTVRSLRPLAWASLIDFQR